jgi:hypothetical protein
MGQLEPALDSDRGEDDNELLAIFAMLNRALLPATGAHRSRPGLQYDNPSGDSFPRVLKCHVAPREWEMETLLQAAFQQDGSQIKGEVIVSVEVRGALRHLAGERFRPKSGAMKQPAARIPTRKLFLFMSRLLPKRNGRACNALDD